MLYKLYIKAHNVICSESQNHALCKILLLLVFVFFNTLLSHFSVSEAFVKAQCSRNKSTYINRKTIIFLIPKSLFQKSMLYPLLTKISLYSQLYVLNNKEILVPITGKILQVKSHWFDS